MQINNYIFFQIIELTRKMIFQKICITKNILK